MDLQITYEGQRAFKIPENNREEYIKFQEEVSTKLRWLFTVRNYDSFWYTYDDPVIVIDFNLVHSREIAEWIERGLKEVGAIDITEQLIDKE